MKENRISIVINKPVQEVFTFTIDPNNTPKWIDGIKEEQISEQPVKVGTIYKNTNNGKDWNVYQVIEFEKNKVFTLKQQGSSYHVRYTYEPLNELMTKLTYFEWNKEGIANPFSIQALEKLKAIIENS